VTRAFYARTVMGASFTDNPVIAVQGRQLSLAKTDEGPLRVLDLGCGAGTPTKLLMADRSKYQVTGADLSEHALRSYVSDTGRSGVQLDAQNLPFASESFDLVVSDDVIEHLVDTDSYAREISRVLSRGGWLFLSTPNLAAWFNRIALALGVQPAFSEVSFEKVFGRPGYDLVGHLRLFTSRSIREFLDYHGFEIIEVRGARFEALPRFIRPIDGLLARLPSLAGNSVIAARKRA
jgi:SAM-dependent methyltransferase